MDNTKNQPQLVSEKPTLPYNQLSAPRRRGSAHNFRLIKQNTRLHTCTRRQRAYLHMLIASRRIAPHTALSEKNENNARSHADTHQPACKCPPNSTHTRALSHVLQPGPTLRCCSHKQTRRDDDAGDRGWPRWATYNYFTYNNKCARHARVWSGVITRLLASKRKRYYSRCVCVWGRRGRRVGGVCAIGTHA